MKRGFCLGLLLVFCFAFQQNAFAQASASSASVSRTRAIANSAPAKTYRGRATFPVPDEIAVEEFINYHRHRIPLPRAGEDVAMDLRWGSEHASAETGEAVLQIGLATAHANDRRELRPLNLSLVIDKSGSMSDADKMKRVKQSLRTFLKQLRRSDTVSIVVFDSTANVVFPSSAYGNGEAVMQSVESIRPGGSTNLHSGLMLGYHEAFKNYDPNATNRVILLTDGIANTGVTDPRRIASESSGYNLRGVDLSTIGVGRDFDEKLLRTLSNQGRGVFHFVADAKDIDKVFRKEVQGLMAPVARKVVLEIDYSPGLQLERVFGYKPEYRSRSIRIPLKDMNSGLTQLVLVKFRVAANMPADVAVRLRYNDLKESKGHSIRRSATLRGFDGADFLSDSLVRKNYTIAELAQSLFDMREDVMRSRHRAAEWKLGRAIRIAKGRYPNMEDENIRLIFDIVRSYEAKLKSFNGAPTD